MVDGPEVIEELFAEESSYGRNSAVVIITTFLMGLITIAAAWSGFQAAKWHGDMVNTFMAARAVHDESVLVALSGNQESFLDIHVFLEWADAVRAEHPELATFYYERMREEFTWVLDDWLATEPLENPEAPRSPFTMPEYLQMKGEQSQELEEQFNDLYDKAVESNHTSENYIMATVILTTGLFFAGIAARLYNRKAEVIMTALALAALVYTAYNLFSYPVLL